MIVIRLYRVIPLAIALAVIALVAYLAISYFRSPLRAKEILIAVFTRLNTAGALACLLVTLYALFDGSTVFAELAGQLRRHLPWAGARHHDALPCRASFLRSAPSPGIPREGRADTPSSDAGKKTLARAASSPTRQQQTCPKRTKGPDRGLSQHVTSEPAHGRQLGLRALASTVRAALGRRRLAGRLAHHLHLHERHHELLLELRADELLVRIFHVALNDLLRLLVEGVRMVQGACHPSRCSRRAPANRPSSCGTPPTS